MSEAVLSHRARGPISLSGAFSLLAVVAVLVVVSLPRLRGLALQENEVDAKSTARSLANALRELGSSPARKPALRELLRRPGLLGLGDSELLAGGQVMRRHGYLFEITCLPPTITAASAPAALLGGEPAALCGLLAIRAWPWDHGTTGRVAFLVTQKGGTLAHPNSGAGWEGVEARGATLESLAGWRPAGP